jgi:hypothetical protein
MISLENTWVVAVEKIEIYLTRIVNHIKTDSYGINPSFNGLINNFVIFGIRFALNAGANF